MLIIPLLMLAAQGSPAPPPPHVASPSRVVSFALDHPCPLQDAKFGQGLAHLDMDGDGFQDLAVGAPGEGKAYVFFGRANSTARRPFRAVYRTFSPVGPRACGDPSNASYLGQDMVGGQLDTDTNDELVVGAPGTSIGGLRWSGSVCIYGARGIGSTPVTLVSPIVEAGRFGESVTIGDFDGDGQMDLAVSAPKSLESGFESGRVFVYPGPFSLTGPVIEIPNPNPVSHGNFGQHLAVADTNFDGIDDLVISAVGNTNAAGGRVAGQVFVFPGPLQPTQFLVIEDPNPIPSDLPAPRFGMHIDARDHFVAIGAPRKDHGGLHDPGMGFVQAGPSFPITTMHVNPNLLPSDYMGFRCLIGDFISDDALDFGFLTLRSRELLIWDGANLNNLTVPDVIITSKPGSADHWGNGSLVARLVPGAREQVILGDPSFDNPGISPANNDAGRVVLYFLP